MGMNRLGGDEFAIGAGPAHQGFNTTQGMRVQVVLGLEVQDQRVVSNRLAQVVFQHHARRSVHGHAFGVVAKTIATLALGFVHGGIGLGQQGARLEVVTRKHRAAYAQADRTGMALQVEGSLHGLHQTLDELIDRLAGVQVFHQHHKLIATQSRQGVIGACRRFQACDDLLQQQITAGMPQGVVDLFETIDIDEQYGDRFFVAPGIQAGLLQAVSE